MNEFPHFFHSKKTLFSKVTGEHIYLRLGMFTSDLLWKDF